MSDQTHNPTYQLFDNPFDTPLGSVPSPVMGTAVPTSPAVASPVPPSGGVGEGRGWHHRSGIVLPAGAMVIETLTAEELEELQDRIDLRALRANDLAARRIRRNDHDTRVLDTMCQWFAEKKLTIKGEVTFTDEYAKRRGIFSLSRALDDVWEGMREVPLRGRAGFLGKFVEAGEWHPSGRNIPHVHMAIELLGNEEALCHALWRYFKRTRGRCRFEPMRDVTDGSMYALKDVLKNDARTSDGYRFKLHYSHGFKPRCDS